MGRTDWFLAGATTVMVALALASVVAAALGCMPLQQPTETTPIWDLAPLPPLPTDAIPGPTVFPEDFWGPRERRVTTGPATAGSLITVYRTDIQLPPNVYVKQKWTSTDCRMGCVCPGRPGVWLGIFDGKSTIILAAGTQIWNPVIAPGEEGAFDWLYEITGVKKGSEMFSGPVDQ